jgi:hypothetical protein
VVITSNNEKELPDAFLRRCFFHYIRFPDRETMMRIVDVHFPGLKKALLAESIARQVPSAQRSWCRSFESSVGRSLSIEKGSDAATAFRHESHPIVSLRRFCHATALRLRSHGFTAVRDARKAVQHRLQVRHPAHATGRIRHDLHPREAPFSEEVLGERGREADHEFALLRTRPAHAIRIDNEREALLRFRRELADQPFACARTRFPVNQALRITLRIAS